MSREIYNLQKAAQHIHIEPNELKHVAQRGEIEAEKRGDDFGSTIAIWMNGRSAIFSHLRANKSMHIMML